MKLITAIKMIEEREKRKRKTEREFRRAGILLKNNKPSKKNPINSIVEAHEQKNLIHVQSIFPEDDVLKLKVKTGEPFIREAIAKAVYFYLKADLGNGLESKNEFIAELEFFIRR